MKQYYFVASDNARIRCARYKQTGDSRGTVVLLHGRSEFIEKYEEPIGKLNARGFDVETFDWRGQGLSERMLPDPNKGFIRSFEQYISDLYEILLEKILPDAKRPVIMAAHSMGGHVALRFVHDYPEMADALVLSAPMIDIYTWPIPAWLVRLLVKIGRPESWMPGNGRYVPERQRFSGNRLTSDARRFFDHVNAAMNNPELAIGGITRGWLRAAYESIDILNAPDYAEGISLPVLMVCAGSDRIVSAGAQERLSKRLPDCRFYLVPGSRHEILKETDEIQPVFWGAFDDFTFFLQSFREN